MKKLVLPLISVLLIFILIAGKSSHNLRDLLPDTGLQNEIQKISENGWIYFKDSFKIDPNEFFNKFKSDLNLSKDDEMKLVNTSHDSIYTFYEFKRFYKNVPFVEAGFTLKYKNEFLQIAIGKVNDIIEFDINSIISPQFALNRAMDVSKATKFAWQDSISESYIKMESKNSSATWFPKERLVIKKSLNGKFKLAYIFCINALEPKNLYQDEYIDAQTGELLTIIPKIYNSVGSGNINYYGNKNDLTTYYTSGHYRLQCNTRGTMTAKLNPNYQQWFWPHFPYLYDSDDNWTDSSYMTAVSALYCAEKVYDYFHSAFGRHGIDNNDRELRITAGYTLTEASYIPGYSYTEDMINIGRWDSDVTRSFATYDIVGHEMTHGIILDENALEYELQESSALNESFCDFFGECAENYAKGNNDWIIGNEFETIGHIFIRNMADPSARNSPSTYGDSNWYSGTYIPDYAHINSSVPSLMLYKLAMGDSNNDIEGIGLSNTASIVYNVLRNYLDNESDFSEAREAMIDYAYSHYDCSTIFDIENAWHAVGVGHAGEICLLETYISGSNTVCSSSTEYTITNLPTGSTISWSCSQNITRISSQGSNPCQFEANTSAENGWIAATVTLNGNQYTLYQKSVMVGSDLSSFVDVLIVGENYELVEHTDNMYSICPNTLYRLQAQSIFNGSVISNWSWTIPESWEIIGNDNLPEILVETGDYITYEDEVTVDVFNSDCQTWTYFADYAYVQEDYGCGESLMLIVYPNPTASTITLQINDTESSGAELLNTNIIISIIDKTGRVWINKVIKENSLNLDISYLPTGEYTVVASNGKAINSQKLIKTD